MAEFVPAVELNRGFYADVVAPLLTPWRHSAALLGSGSQVLGYDTERSTDHGWGPRVAVFAAADDVHAAQRAVDAGLPREYRGWPVAFGWDAYEPRHYVEVTTIEQWFTRHLGFDPRQPIATLDWLTTPQELLLEAIGGAVYHDGLGELEPARRALAQYPHDVWRWMVACQWRRIDQEEPFTGRTAEVGDEIGSRLLAAKHVRLLMELHFLYERTYWPYSKWFGTAYARLYGSAALLSIFDAATAATTFAAREDALVAAVEQLAIMHNASGLPRVDPPTTQLFHNRPFRVIAADRFVQACLGTVTDPWFGKQPLVGAIDQFADNVDVVTGFFFAHRLRSIYSDADVGARPGTVFRG